MEKARQHYEKGMNALQNTSSFFGLFGSPPDFIIAAHEFEQAGNLLKSSQDHFGASSAYDKAAQAHYEMESYFLAAKLWDSCGYLVTKANLTGIEYYKKAAKAYILGGSPENAMKSLYNCCKLCEPLTAIEYYLEIAQILEDDSDVLADTDMVQKGLLLSLGQDE